MSTTAMMIMLAVVIPIALMVFFIARYVKTYNHSVNDLQSIFSDKEMLLFIGKRELVSVEDIVEESGMKKSEVKARISHLHQSGLLASLYSRSFKYYYKLKSPIKSTEGLQLTNSAFLSFEDVIQIFQHYNFNVNLQDLCIATGLPIKVLQKEMKRFEKEGILKLLYESNGITTSKIYILNEPYRTHANQFEGSKKETEFELKQIYEKVKRNREGFQ